MHGIVETAAIREVADPRLGFRVAGAEIARTAQSELAHVIGHGLTSRREHSVEMGTRTAELPSDKRRAQPVRCHVPLDEDLRRSEKPA